VSGGLVGSFLDKFKKQGSLSDAIEEVRASYRAACQAMAAPMMGDSPGGYVVDVYDDHVVACDESGDYWSIPYTREAGSDDVTFDFEGATEVERDWTPVAKTVVFEKVDDDSHTAFGWGYVYEKADGTPVRDHSEEFIEKDDLETAAYAFNLESREGDERHGEAVEAHLIESFVVTPEKLEKMGVAADALPHGWWTGWYIPDDEMFGKIKDGTYPMLSIGGVARKEHVDA
jgi:hypothetical protein